MNNSFLDKLMWPGITSWQKLIRFEYNLKRHASCQIDKDKNFVHSHILCFYFCQFRMSSSGTWRAMQTLKSNVC